MNNDRKQTVTLNLAIDVDLSQLVSFLRNHVPAQTTFPPVPEPAITLQEAAKLLSCSDQKVRDLVNQGEIPEHCAFRVGSLYRFRRRELLDWFCGTSAARTA
jgi:excisionase family DNA binding protein